MTDYHLRLDLRISRRAIAAGLALLVLVAAVDLSSESMTLTTYYPAPSGIYTSMTTTGNTFLARDGGNIGVGTQSPGAKLHVQGTMLTTGNVTLARDGGNVGVGTDAPASKFTVAGGLQLGDDTSECAAPKNGALRWHESRLEVCSGSGWVELGGDSEEQANKLVGRVYVQQASNVSYAPGGLLKFSSPFGANGHSSVGPVQCTYIGSPGGLLKYTHCVCDAQIGTWRLAGATPPDNGISKWSTWECK